MDIDPALLESIKSIISLAGAGSWLAVVAAVVVLAMKLLRGPLLKLLPETNKFRLALETKWGGWGMNLLLSLGVSFGAAAAAATPMTVASVVAIVMTALISTLAAAGGHELSNDARSAGQAKADAVKSKEDAISDLDKP